MTRSAARWSAVGWQRLYLEVPDGWNIGAVSGNEATGYLRLDDMEMPRVEARWEPAKGNEPIRATVDRYLDALVKKTRKKSAPVTVRRDLSLLKTKANADMLAVEGFQWRTEGTEPLQSYGLLWRCEVCKRIVFVQVFGAAGEALFPIASRVLNSLRDHPEGETVIWAMYGMRVGVPVSMTLKEHQFLTGRLMMRFTGENSTIEVERLSLADRQLKGQSFEAWFDDANEGDVLERSPLDTGIFRHPGVLTSGEMIDPDASKSRLRWVPGFKPKMKPLICCGWHCVNSNKLYIVRWFGDAATPERVLTLTQSVECH